ncbi:unknown similar to AMEV240 [Choristoneura biennis entomopoxvirus]|uniref:Uncharacterized protein n=1 Tax=Choristoneura biennis entomopoxvirus TaxID=10288 RepID=A0A916P1H1_CBEPV|nr:unknown similar to AMEV240 [Choristoneura biennis entomopoxvirus]CCU55844.1 unknown similar to AMEV240 [Choristoneura biennis entomopoxvirus]
MDILLIASKVSYFSDHNVYIDEEQRLEVLHNYNNGLINNYIKNNKNKYNSIIDNYNENECNKLLNDIKDTKIYKQENNLTSDEIKYVDIILDKQENNLTIDDDKQENNLTIDDDKQENNLTIDEIKYVDLDKQENNLIINKVDNKNIITIDVKKKILNKKIKNMINNSVIIKNEQESKSNINMISDNKLKNKVLDNLSLKRGLFKEDYNINKYEEAYNVTITNRNKYYIKKLLSFEYNSKTINIIVCGKIDGINNDILIESKNRRNKLFKYIPIYERVQLEMYLFLSKFKKCNLIQHYNNDIGVLEYEKDESLFVDICDNIIFYFKKMFKNNTLNINYNQKI